MGKSARRGQLKVVVSDVAGDGLPAIEQQPATPAHDASIVLGNVVMYAAMAWVAACLEQTAENVEVSQVGAGVFDAVVHLSDGKEQWLRVMLALKGGAAPQLSTTVEPLHP